MKYFFLILLTFTAFSEREMEIQHARNSGRNGFKCIKDTCLAIGLQNFGIVDLDISNKMGQNWYDEYDFDPSSNPVNINDGMFSNSFILDKDSQYFYHRRDDGTIFYTNDGGESFRKRNLKTIKNTDLDILMFDKELGLISSILQLTFTANGWETWEHVKYDSLNVFRTILKISDSTCYITSIINQGENGVDNWYHCLVEFNIKTKELKVKYIIEEKFDNQFDMNLLYFIDEKIGFMGGSEVNVENERDILFKTSDGGKTWNKVLDETNCCFYLKDIAFNSDGSYGITVDANKYYETFDKGETWIFGRFPLGFQEGNHVYCQVEFAGDRCLIGSMGKGIYAWEEITSVTLEDIGNLRVWQTGTNLRVGSDINGLFINIFDLQGNITNTTDFNKNTILDLSDKPSGTYLFNIIHQNQIIQTGKFSLVN